MVRKGSSVRVRLRASLLCRDIVMLADARGNQQTLMASVTRHRFKSPTVGEFKTLSDRVQPQIDAAFRRGFLGFG
jgi:hypothetical protein